MARGMAETQVPGRDSEAEGLSKSDGERLAVVPGELRIDENEARRALGILT